MFRKAEISDLPSIMKILQATLAEMRTYHNNQWDQTYPAPWDFAQDIACGELYLITEDSCRGSIQGFICLNLVEPVAYQALPWSLSQPALVVHRMSVDPQYRRQGLGQSLLRFADQTAQKEGLHYLKTDTYAINDKMNRLFQKTGYHQIGTMNYRGKDKLFNCYEKQLLPKFPFGN